MDKVDILTPPDFRKTGQVKTAAQAVKDGDWVGVFHLWVIKSKPQPMLLYQIRGSGSPIEPGKLDVTVGGHYQAGETSAQGLREAEEEIGRRYHFKDLTFLGKKLWFGHDRNGNPRQTAVDVFFIQDDSSLSKYHLHPQEVNGLVACPINQLIKVHQNKKYHFTASGLDPQGNNIIVNVSQNSFPYNWDNYHFKITLLAQRFLSGEKNIIY